MPQHGVFLVGIAVPVVVEKRHEPVIFIVPEGVVRMVVALYAGESGAHQRLPGRVHAVEHSRRAKLLVVGAALVVVHGVAVESGGD